MRRRKSRVMKKRRSRTSTRKTDRRRTRNVRQLRKKRSERTNKRTKRTNNKRTNNKRRNNKRTKRRRGVNHRGGAAEEESLCDKSDRCQVLMNRAREVEDRFGPESDDPSEDQTVWDTYWKHAGYIIDDIELKLKKDAADGTVGDGAGDDSPEVRVLITDFLLLAKEFEDYSKNPQQQQPGKVAADAKEGNTIEPTKRIWMLDATERDALRDA
jgi:hypothetical protein